MNRMSEIEELELQLVDLRGEVELLRHIVAGLLMQTSDAGRTVDAAFANARVPLGEPTLIGMPNPPRIALDHARTRFLKLLRP